MSGNGQKLRVFVSSTFLDLKEYRQAAMSGIRQLGLEAVGMEDYVAEDKRLAQKCRDDVANCDIYVGIFAWRYGTRPEGDDNPNRLSITELEYEKAFESGMPRFAFRLERHDWMLEYIDRDRTLIEGLHARTNADRVATPFSSPADLKGQVIVVLQQHLGGGHQGPSSSILRSKWPYHVTELQKIFEKHVLPEYLAASAMRLWEFRASDVGSWVDFLGVLGDRIDSAALTHPLLETAAFFDGLQEVAEVENELRQWFLEGCEIRFPGDGDAAGRCRSQARLLRDTCVGESRLVIRIEPDTSNGFLLTCQNYVCKLGTRKWRQVPPTANRQVAEVDRLEEALVGLLGQVARTLRSCKVIEVVLPIDLMVRPIDCWRVRINNLALPTRIGSYRSVVFRPLERLLDEDVRDTYQALHQRLGPRALDVQVVSSGAWDRDWPSCLIQEGSGVVVSKEPPCDVVAVLEQLIGAGAIGVVVPRQSVADVEWELSPSGTEFVHALRREAHQNQADHPGHHLILVLDDPETAVNIYPPQLSAPGDQVG